MRDDEAKLFPPQSCFWGLVRPGARWRWDPKKLLLCLPLNGLADLTAIGNGMTFSNKGRNLNADANEKLWTPHQSLASHWGVSICTCDIQITEQWPISAGQFNNQHLHTFSLVSNDPAFANVRSDACGRAHRNNTVPWVWHWYLSLAPHAIISTIQQCFRVVSVGCFLIPTFIPLRIEKREEHPSCPQNNGKCSIGTSSADRNIIIPFNDGNVIHYTWKSNFFLHKEESTPAYCCWCKTDKSTSKTRRYSQTNFPILLCGEGWNDLCKTGCFSHFFENWLRKFLVVKTKFSSGTFSHFSTLTCQRFIFHPVMRQTISCLFSLILARAREAKVTTSWAV